MAAKATASASDAPTGDQDLGVRVVVDAVHALDVLRERASQLEGAVVAGVVRAARSERADALLDDLRRRGEVGLTDAEADHVRHGGDHVEELADAGRRDLRTRSARRWRVGLATGSVAGVPRACLGGPEYTRAACAPSGGVWGAVDRDGHGLGRHGLRSSAPCSASARHRVPGTAKPRLVETSRRIRRLDTWVTPCPTASIRARSSPGGPCARAHRSRSPPWSAWPHAPDRARRHASTPLATARAQRRRPSRRHRPRRPPGRPLRRRRRRISPTPVVTASPPVGEHVRRPRTPSAAAWSPLGFHLQRRRLPRRQLAPRRARPDRTRSARAWAWRRLCTGIRRIRSWLGCVEQPWRVATAGDRVAAWLLGAFQVAQLEILDPDAQRGSSASGDAVGARMRREPATARCDLPAAVQMSEERRRTRRRTPLDGAQADGAGVAGSSRRGRSVGSSARQAASAVMPS